MIYWLIFRTLLSGIILLYVQVLFMPRLAVAGIVPNLFLGWIIYQVWKKPLNLLVPIIFVLGLCLDLTTPYLLGLQTAVLIVLITVADGFHRPLERDSFVTMGLTTVLIVVLYSLLMYVVYGFQDGFSGALFGKFLGMLAYNLVITGVLVTILVMISHLKLDFRHD